MHNAITNRYLSMMMPDVSPEIEEAQRAFLATKTEAELRQIINDCYDLQKAWCKRKKKKRT